MRRIAALLLCAGCILAVVVATAAARPHARAVQPAVLTGVQVVASDGGSWATYSTGSPCGQFHLFISPRNQPLDPGTLSDTVSDGYGSAAQRYMYWIVGNDGSSWNAAETLNLYFNGSGTPGISVTAHAPKKLGDASVWHGAARAVVGPRLILLRRFRFWNGNGTPGAPNLVGSCSVGADGFPHDSVGSFVLEVHQR